MKEILLACDEKGWGGWKRAKMIKKYLSDEFNFTLKDHLEFNQYEKKPNKRYDLIYLLFHTMLIKKSVTRMLKSKKYNFITMVTVYPTIRPIFQYYGKATGTGAKNTFLQRANECKAILANNKKSLRDLRNIYKGKSFLAPRGVDTNVFFPTSDFVRKKPEDFTIAFCGKPNPEKGFESIIKPACEEAGVKLIDNQRNFTDALTEDEMREFYNSADAYIVASTMDGTPNTALEAAACGKPIISNEIGNMPEFINGSNGWLVDLDKEEYINKIQWMKNNQREVYEMGLEARRLIVDYWTWEKLLNKNERMIFRKVLNAM